MEAQDPLKGQRGSTKVSSSLCGELYPSTFLQGFCRAVFHLWAFPGLPFLWLFIFHFLPFVLSENHGHQWLPIVGLCLFEACLWLGPGSCSLLPVNSRALGFHKERFCLFTQKTSVCAQPLAAGGGADVPLEGPAVPGWVLGLSQLNFYPGSFTNVFLWRCFCVPLPSCCRSVPEANVRRGCSAKRFSFRNMFMTRNIHWKTGGTCS